MWKVTYTDTLSGEVEYSYHPTKFLALIAARKRRDEQMFVLTDVCEVKNQYFQ